MMMECTRGIPPSPRTSLRRWRSGPGVAGHQCPLVTQRDASEVSILDSPAAGEPRRRGLDAPEPPQRLRRLNRLWHAAVTGLENRVSTIDSASATLGERFGEQLCSFRLECVGDVFQEDEPQGDVLVVGWLHVAAQLVGHRSSAS